MSARSASRPTPRPGVLDISAYVPGRDHVEGVAKVWKLSSNETPLGPSPKAVEDVRGGRPPERPATLAGDIW